MQQDQLKILFWVSPITEMAWPWQKLAWIKTFIPQIEASLSKAGYVIDSNIILSTDLKNGVDVQGVHIGGRLVLLSQGELLDGYRFNALVETVHYQGTRDSSAFFSHLGGLVREKLGSEYVPDVVISFSPSPFFAELYPQAVLLYHELGVFSRSPYPETYYFDPNGITGQNFVASFADKINMVNPESVEFIEELASFRQSIIKALLSNADIASYFSNLRKSYHRLLLVPLGYEGFADARVNFPYQTQLEFVEHILDSVDGGTAVLLTQHPARRALSDDAIHALRVSHSNLLNEPFYYQVANFSQVAIAYCDACITQSSSLAYQAAFLGKYLVTVGGFCAGIADGHSVVDLPSIYDTPPVNRDNFFVWVIRHHITDVANMPQHLKHLIETWRGDPPKEMEIASWPEGFTIEDFRRQLQIWRKNIHAPECRAEACLTVFFDMGSGFSADNARLILRVEEDSPYGEVLVPEGCVRIRVDPDEGHAIAVSEIVCRCGDVVLDAVEQNGQRTPDGWLFLTNDPQFIFNVPTDVKVVTIKVKFSRLAAANALMLCEQERQSMKCAVATREDLLVGVRTELARLRVEHDGVRAELARLISEHDSIRVEFTRLTAEHSCLITEHNHTNAELAAARIESMTWKRKYDEISSSTCWRITKPIRFVLDNLKILIKKTS